MTCRIVIAGAGGFGRGVFGWLEDSARHREVHGVTDVVFIDDNIDPEVAPQAPVVSTIRAYSPEPGDEVLCAIGVPHIRRKVVEMLRERGVKFHTFVDDRAIIGSRAQIGQGTVICPGVVVSADALIGEQVHINFNCSVGHDTVLGDFATLSPSVNLMGEVNVGTGVFFGGSAVVLPRTSVSAWATLGAGAVLVHGAKPGTTLIGNPAREQGRLAGA